MNMPKLLVLGLDGASWSLLDPWINKGILPNFKRIKEEGAWGDMESCLPPVTSPNWKCYSTGKNPGKLGVYWWENIDLKNRRISIPNSYSYKGREIWDYMGEKGLKTAIINMPTTYPPKKVNGCMISGGPVCEEQGFTYSKELEKKLKSQFNYHIHIKKDAGDLTESNPKAINEAINLINLRFRTMKYLIEKDDYDFVHLTIFLINVLQHFFWDGQPVKLAWQEIDKNLGYFLVNKNTNIILMSDHGCNKIEKEFYINNWLKKEGYLSTRTSIVDFLCGKGIHKGILSKALEQIPFNKALKKLIPSVVKSNIPEDGGIVKKKAKAKIIDWNKTLAIASGQGPIYLNVNKDNPYYYNKLREKLILKLERLKDSNGNKVIKKAYRREEIYNGEYINEAPDIVIDQNDGFHINGGIGGKGIFTKPKKWIAENKRQGLFATWGRDIKEGYQFNNIRIIDIAPTILHYLEIPISDDMDGRVLKEIFRKNSHPCNRKETYYSPITERYAQDNIEEQAEIRKRLRDLGYLD